MAASLLERGLAALRLQGLPGNDLGWSTLHGRLKKYLAEIELWNPKLGLVEASGDELVGRHILDSLAAFGLLAQLLEQSDPQSTLAMADIGSGAGLPGIPLLLAVECLMPEWQGRFSMTLVEKQQRRIGFLLNAKAILGLAKLDLRQDKVESLAAEGLRFNIISARAFAPLEPGILAVLQGILAKNGQFFFYKGRLAKIDEELASVGLPRKLAQDLADLPAETPPQALVVPLVVPFLSEERHLVFIRPDAGVC